MTAKLKLGLPNYFLKHYFERPPAFANIAFTTFALQLRPFSDLVCASTKSFTSHLNASQLK